MGFRMDILYYYKSQIRYFKAPSSKIYQLMCFEPSF